MYFANIEIKTTEPNLMEASRLEFFTKLTKKDTKVGNSLCSNFKDPTHIERPQLGSVDTSYQSFRRLERLYYF